MKPLSNFESIVFNVSDCHEWYMYGWGEDATEEDKLFFGENTGLPMSKPVDKGMIASGSNVLTAPCKEINRTVPYFLP